MTQPHADQHERDALLLEHLGVQGPDGQQTITWGATFGGYLGRDPETYYVLARHHADVVDLFRDEENLVVTPCREPTAYDVTLEHTRGTQAEWDAWTARPDVTQWLQQHELLEAAIDNVARLTPHAKDRVRQRAIDNAFGKQRLTLTAYGEHAATRHQLQAQWPRRAAASGSEISVVGVSNRGPVAARPPTPPDLQPGVTAPARQPAAHVAQTMRTASYPNASIGAPAPTPAGPIGRSHTPTQPTQAFER